MCFFIALQMFLEFIIVYRRGSINLTSHECLLEKKEEEGGGGEFCDVNHFSHFE